MSAPTSEAPTDAFPPAKHAARPFIPRMIRAFAIPIILVWIAVIAVVNVVVPQLETVGQMRAVSMSPDSAPSMIAMKRVGQVFEEFNSDSSAMIVLEGDKPLGDDTRAFYGEMIEQARSRQEARPERSGLLERPADRRRRAEQRRHGRLRPGLPRG